MFFFYLKGKAWKISQDAKLLKHLHFVCLKFSISESQSSRTLKVVWV